MSILIQLFVLTFFVFEGIHSQKCSDCVNVYVCPRAMDLLQKRESEYIDLFRNASCGIEKRGTKITPQVCCSMLSITEEVGASEDQAIANHRNLELLSEECGHINVDRLLGGNQAHLYQFPWVALIALNISSPNPETDFRCVGSIINKRYVLTSAVCIKNNQIVGVRVGEYDINTHVDCEGSVCEDYIQDIEVEQSVIHEDFKRSPAIVNNIGLLRLAEDIDFNHRNVHRICLPTTSEQRRQDVSNRVATLAGLKHFCSLTSSVLQKAMVPILTTESCQHLYNRFFASTAADKITSKFLCAGGENKDACEFITGSPLMLEESNNNIQRYVQYGILSFGPFQCGSGTPEVHTDVRKYMKWILDNIRP